MFCSIRTKNKVQYLTTLISLFCIILAVPVNSQTSSGSEPTQNRIIKLSFENTSWGAFQYKKISKPKVGLALSGGGLRGFAHIGILEVFEEEGIPIDYIAASSIGAIVGGLYAVGYTPAELFDFAAGTDWRQIFVDTPLRSSLFIQQKIEAQKHLFTLRFDGIKPYIPPSISQGQQILNMLNSLIVRTSFNPNSNFDQLRVPIRIVATNMLTGEEKVFDRGDLSQVILGSISIPLLFSAIPIDGEYYWDAGLLNNIPTNVARDMGSDLVIAVNTTADLRPLDRMAYPWEIADQLTTISQKARNEELLKLADIIITPDLGDRDSYDFNAISEYIELGREKAKEMISGIKSRLSTLDNTENSFSKVNISTIIVSGNEHFDTQNILDRIDISPGSNVTDGQIRTSLEKVFNLGFFENVYAEIISSGNGSDLVIHIQENPIIENFIIAGNTAFTEQEIIRMYPDFEEPAYNIRNALAFIQNLSGSYLDKGFALTQVREFKIDTLSRSLIIKLDEGKIHEIRIAGNNITKTHVVRREVPLKKGDIFDFRKAQNGIYNLFGSGLFQRVRPEILYENDKLIFVINLEEHKPEMMRIGAHYNLDHETHAYMELINDNFLGTGMKSLIHSGYGQREEMFKYQFRADRIFKSYFSFDGSLQFHRTKQYLTDPSRDFEKNGDYTDRRFGGSVSIGRQIGRFGNVSALLNIENVKTEAIPFDDISNSTANYLSSQVDDTFDLRTIRIQSVIDTRDKYPFPNKGNYHDIYYETAGSFFGGKQSYAKLYASLGLVFTVNQRHTYEQRFTFGFADETLPYAQRFKWGGLDTFFGKGLNTLHGKILMASNIGYRFKIPLQNMPDTYLKFRYDFIRIADNREDFKLKGLKTGIGGSLSIDLPIGPIEVGYGSTLGEVERLYFSLGHKF